MRSVLALGCALGLLACSTPPAGDSGTGGGFALGDLASGGFDAGASKSDTGKDAGVADTGLSDVASVDDTESPADDAESPPPQDVEEDAPDLAGFFDDDSGSNGGDCTVGQIICVGNTAKTCDGKGGFLKQTTCPDACVPGKGCGACVPNSTTCSGKSAQKCKPDGSGWEAFNCDAELGFTCDEATGKCTGACATADGARSYIGCEYWPTVTSNSLLYPGFAFAVAIANTTGKPADVTIRKGSTVVQKVQVAANSVQTVKLPWVDELKHDGSKASTKAALDASVPSSLVADGAYQLKSTQPVTVYQFNPLEFEIPFQSACSNPFDPGACHSYTNDASLLLPTNSLGKEYLVAALPGSGFKPMGQALTSRPGFVAIVATQDKTAVHIDSKAAVRAGPGVSAIAAGKGADFTLNQGDVLQLMIAPMTDSTPMTCGATLPNLAKFCKANAGFDLTGSKITASAPVQVIGGHDCTNVPFDVQACDHVEETLFPLNTWGNSVLVAPAQSVSGAKTANGLADQQLLRVISGADNNQLTFDPPAPGMAGKVLQMGEFVEIAKDKNAYQISGTGPILVLQATAGGDLVDPNNVGTPNSKGDPSMSLAVPTTQYRKDYTFLTPATYTYSFVNIIAKVGTPIELDGGPVQKPFTAIGNTGYAVARVPVAGGTHHIVGPEPFGVVVYGYAAYTSYMYPGGLDLNVQGN